MTASEKLQQLIENDELTEEQLDNLNDWGIQTVSELRDCLIDLINKLKNETYSVDYADTIMALSDLLDYDEDDYVVYDVDGVTKLDFDTLNDALDTDQKKGILKMKNTKLKSSFEDYAVNELVNKLHELKPLDYESLNGEHIEVDDLMNLLLEDEYTNGCYYLYTKDNEKVFKKYFKDILYICNSFGYDDEDALLPIDLETGSLLLLVIKRVFEALLETTMTSYTKFTRAGLDMIADRVAGITHDNLVQLVY